MKFYTDDFLSEKREQWLQAFRTAQANVNGVWYNGEIQEKKIEGNKIVLHVVFSSLDEITCTISQLRILDKNGFVVGNEIVNVHKIATQSTLFKFDFPIWEVEE